MHRIDALWLHWPETKALAQAVAPLRFVGGCVRDALLGLDVADVDAATPLTPGEVLQRLEKAGLKGIPTGFDHGTVTARIGERHFEITTLRHDISTDGRHAVVAFTESWQEDAARRDFTMNALYCDGQGTVYDYCNGAEDAKAGRVRFIGDARERIREDALRILRFFRFFAHYGAGPVDADALVACGELAPLMDGLSGERIAQELFKLLKAERAAEVVELMQRHAVWPRVVPAVVKTQSLERLPQLLRLAGRASDPLLALALLLRSTGHGTEVADKVARRWKLSKLQAKRLSALCGALPVLLPKEGDDIQWKKQIRQLGAALFCDRMLIGMAEGGDEASALKAITLARAWQPPVFPVTGDDLIAQGVRPGRELGEKLKAMEKMWEESGYAMDKERLLAQN